MRDRESILGRLASAADLSSEPIPGLPLVELLGKQRVLIENHHGVIQYCPNEIVIKVSYGPLIICGCGLKLSLMTKQQLIVTGQIRQIQLGGR